LELDAIKKPNPIEAQQAHGTVALGGLVNPRFIGGTKVEGIGFDYRADLPFTLPAQCRDSAWAIYVDPLLMRTDRRPSPTM